MYILYITATVLGLPTSPFLQCPKARACVDLLYPAYCLFIQ